jgi:hypothetical protein
MAEPLEAMRRESPQAGIFSSHRWSSLSYFLLSEILDKIITPVQ